MPTPFSELDTNFPFFRKNEGTEEKINELQDYMFLLLENLRWTLNHLDERNITEEGKKRITEPLTIDIKDAVEGLQTEIEILPGQILATVAANYLANSARAGILADAASYADGVGSTISAQVAATYETQEAAAGILVDAKAYADGAVGEISLWVKDSDGETELNMKGGRIDFTGYTTFSGLASGTTVINGGCLQTGTINANLVSVNNAFAVGRVDGQGVFTADAYLGAGSGATTDGTTTYGAKLMSANNSGIYAIVTNAGIRIQAGSNRIVVTENSVTCNGTPIGQAVFG